MQIIGMLYLPAHVVEIFLFKPDIQRGSLNEMKLLLPKPYKRVI
jgi:hypothetical protein